MIKIKFKKAELTPMYGCDKPGDQSGEYVLAIQAEILLREVRRFVERAADLEEQPLFGMDDTISGTHDEFIRNSFESMWNALKQVGESEKPDT